MASVSADYRYYIKVGEIMAIIVGRRVSAEKRGEGGLESTEHKLK